MDRFIEFAINNYALVGIFCTLLICFLVLESRRAGKSVSPQELTNLMNRDGALVVDIREPNEFKSGHLPDAKNIPFPKLQEGIKNLENYKEKPIILVCKMGQHSGAAGRTLHKQGYKDVRRLKGGIATWSAEGLPLVRK